MELCQSRTDGDGNAIAAYSFANGHGYSREYPDEYSDQYGNGHGDPHGYVHSHAQRNAYKYPNTNSHTNG
jgi:hypothetical protein